MWYLLLVSLLCSTATPDIKNHNFRFFPHNLYFNKATNSDLFQDDFFNTLNFANLKKKS